MWVKIPEQSASWSLGILQLVYVACDLKCVVQRHEKCVCVLQDVYPLTLALEKEGPKGVDLQKLQLAAQMQLAGRSAGPPVPPGSPSRTKAGKAHLLRTWRQE